MKTKTYGVYLIKSGLGIQKHGWMYTREQAEDTAKYLREGGYWDEVVILED